VNRYPGQFPADPQAVGKTSRFTRFLVSGDRELRGLAVATRQVIDEDPLCGHVFAS
jgi:hypothetical protein